MLLKSILLMFVDTRNNVMKSVNVNLAQVFHIDFGVNGFACL